MARANRHVQQGTNLKRSLSNLSRVGRSKQELLLLLLPLLLVSRRMLPLHIFIRTREPRRADLVIYHCKRLQVLVLTVLYFIMCCSQFHALFVSEPKSLTRTLPNGAMFLLVKRLSDRTNFLLAKCLSRSF